MNAARFLLLCTLASTASAQTLDRARAEALLTNASPAGTSQLTVRPTAGDFHVVVADLELTLPDGRQRTISGVRGNGFLVSDLGQAIVLDACESNTVPTVLRVLDGDGVTRFRDEVRGLTNARLASDGRNLIYATPAGEVTLDLRTFRKTHELRSSERMPARRGPGASGSSPRNAAPLGPAMNPTTVAGPVTPTPTDGAFPWPFLPNVQQPIGNTYGEFQEYSAGSEYLHPGIDILGADGQPVYAVRSGWVKAILTTSGAFHWRVAIGDAPTGELAGGHLYAHLDLPTIAVEVGDFVTAGQYLGDLVPWPVAGFTHIHFSSIQHTGVTWDGAWLCTKNPHTRLPALTETSPPFFEDAVGTDLFAFCVNETSTYLSPTALTGQVDIIAKIGDLIDAAWICSVQEIRYTIHPLGSPDSPVVDDKLAVDFDMALDTYFGGPIDPFLVDLLFKEDSTCNTNGDYNNRDFFHILTNSSGDSVYEPSDALEAWDTTLVPNGDYVVEVTAWDAARNATTATMTVTVSNP